jgi:hypothetical protein
MPIVLFVGGLGAAILLMLVGGRTCWKRRVTRWAGDNGMKLLEFSGALFYQGPRAFRRSDNRFTFRVMVEDAAGGVRSGWLTFGSSWSFWPAGDPEVHWDS